MEYFLVHPTLGGLGLFLHHVLTFWHVGHLYLGIVFAPCIGILACGAPLSLVIFVIFGKGQSLDVIGINNLKNKAVKNRGITLNNEGEEI